MDTNIRITQDLLCDLSTLPTSARRCPNRYNRPTLEIRKQTLRSLELVNAPLNGSPSTQSPHRRQPDREWSNGVFGVDVRKELTWSKWQRTPQVSVAPLA